jgi:hypothetical protein
VVGAGVIGSATTSPPAGAAGRGPTVVGAGVIGSAAGSPPPPGAAVDGAAVDGAAVDGAGSSSP